MQIAATVQEGDEIAGFRVVHLPGHAPGLIGLFRERDGLALVSDHLLHARPPDDPQGPPRLPLAAFNLDTEQARASLRKLAALEPRAAWPGHADPVTGDVRAARDGRRDDLTRPAGDRGQAGSRARAGGEALGPDQRLHRPGR